MPTNYTGSPTATQAPSPPPTPEAAPIVSYPADGESANAASVAQDFRVLADYAAWLMKPRAKANDWAMPIERWRSAALHRRFGIDHFGFPAGRLNHRREDFAVNFSHLGTISPAPFGAAAGVAIPGSMMESWRYEIRQQTTSSFAEIDVMPPSAAIGRVASRSIRLSLADSAGDYTNLARVGTCLFDITVCASVEWDARIHNVADTMYAHLMGIIDGLGTQPTLVANGAFFFWDSSIAQWRCITDNGGVRTSTTTSVVGDNLWHQFKIVWVGATVDDAGASRVLFFIDGALVANLTTNLPPSTSLVVPFYGAERIAGGAASSAAGLYIAPPNIANNTWTDAF